MKIRLLGTDDLEQLHDIRTRAFGQAGPDAPLPGTVRRAVTEGRVLGVYDGTRLVGSGGYHAFEQWWHGRAVPMGGVSAVCVAPEDRGRGVGRRLIAALLDLLGDRPLSALYPATAPVYRAVGYEHAGAQYRVTLPADALRTLSGPPVEVRRAGPADAGEVAAVLRRLHANARDAGPVDPGEAFLREALDDGRVFSYLADDGFLAYGWHEADTELIVYRCVAGSPETARALWAIVGSGSSVARTVRACVAPGDPVLWLLRDRSEDEATLVRWMLRVLDAPAAIAARGFPAGVTADVPLILHDEHRPGNTGAWRLTVEAGAGRLEPAAERSEATRLRARGLAALYAGVPMATLRRSGLARGGDATDPVLDAAFAATPFMLNYF